MTDDIQASDAPEPSIRDTMREVVTGASQDAVESPSVQVEETPAPQINQGDEQVSEGTEGAAQAPAAIQAPISWSDQDKQTFAKLPPEAQNIISRRESERDRFVNQKSDELSRVKQEYGAVDSALSDINHVLRQNNMTSAQAVKELVDLYKNFTQDPVGYLQRAAQSAGIDLHKLATGQLDTTQIQQQTLQAKIAELENRLNQTSSREEVQQNQYAQAEIDKFTGRPENKHFDSVREDMILLLNAGKAQTLEDAYDKACRLNPDIFEQIQKEKAKEKAKQLNDNAQNAKSKAGVKLRTREMSSSSSPSSGSIRDTMAEVVRELSAGAA